MTPTLRLSRRMAAVLIPTAVAGLSYVVAAGAVHGTALTVTGAVIAALDVAASALGVTVGHTETPPDMLESGGQQPKP